MFIKHDRKSIRLKGYDYGNNGLYFITICTGERYSYFGDIINNKIKLNWCGGIINDEILKTKKMRNEIKIHEYCIMPNHIHILLEIYKNKYDYNQCNITIIGVGNRHFDVGNRHFGVGNRHFDVGNRRACSLQNKTSRNNELLFHVIGSLKSSCTREINKIHPYYFKWQKSFHDHIIRNNMEYEKIKNYIINNPKMWYRDRNNK